MGEGISNSAAKLLGPILVFSLVLSGPISRDTAILSLRYPISRDTFLDRLALPQNGAIPPPWYLVSDKHICAIPHFATYRAIIVRYPIKTSTKEFCDTIARSIARYEKYRCWASNQENPRAHKNKIGTPPPPNPRPPLKRGILWTWVFPAERRHFSRCP